MSTRVVTTLDEASAAAGPDTTLLIAVPDLLTDRSAEQPPHGDRATPAAAPSSSPPAPRPSSTLAPGVTADPAISFDSTLVPDCDLPAARRAGTADTGGFRYDTTAPGADACYPSNGLPTLRTCPGGRRKRRHRRARRPRHPLQRPSRRARQRLARPPTPRFPPHLVWYLPSLSDASRHRRRANRSFFDLLPSGWLWGTLQLFVAAALAALWRARRLGPLVPERLPVAIRASETVEGRARLYRKANARDRAAGALRSTTRTRLAPLVRRPRAPRHTRPRPCSPPCPPSSRTTAADRPCTPSSSARRPATTPPSSPSPTNSTPSKERYAVHDGPDH